MCIKISRTLSIALCAAFLTFAAHSALAQSGDAKTPAAVPADPAKEFTDASRVIVGPAGNPECVWLGRRVLSRLWDDDLETAFRHLDLYDRFGCPAPHIQQAFRCIVRQGNLPSKTAPEVASAQIKERVTDCWLNPARAVQPAAAVASPAPSTK